MNEKLLMYLPDERIKMSKFHKNPKQFDADPETYGRFILQCRANGLKMSFAINEAIKRWTIIMEKRTQEDDGLTK